MRVLILFFLITACNSSTKIYDQSAFEVLKNINSDTELTLECGTYQVFHKIESIVRQGDYKVTLNIPECATIESHVHNDNTFSFVTWNLGVSELKISGSGTIDLRNMVATEPVSSSNTAFVNFRYFRSVEVSGLNLIGSQETTDSFITGRAVNIDINNNSMSGSADSAVYLNGHILNVGDIELSNIANVYENVITDTRSGIDCKRGISHCVIENNYIEADTRGIRCEGVWADHVNPYPCVKLTVKNNEIVAPYGAWLDWCTNCLVENNKVSDVGVVMSNTQDTIVINSGEVVDQGEKLVRYGNNYDSRPSINNRF